MPMTLLTGYQHIFQVGYVTRDLDRAMMVIDHEIGPTDFLVAEHTVPVLADGEPSEITMRVAITSAGGRQIEVIQPVAGAIGLYIDGIDFAASDLVFHHIGIGVTGPHTNWETLEAQLGALGRSFKVLFPPEPGPDPLARYGYLDTRAWCGHYTEYLWWSEAMRGSPTYPGFDTDQ
jgi:hypothetical protein